jgi:hypothetical protein
MSGTGEHRHRASRCVPPGAGCQEAITGYRVKFCDGPGQHVLGEGIFRSPALAQVVGEAGNGDDVAPRVPGAAPAASCHNTVKRCAAQAPKPSRFTRLWATSAAAGSAAAWSPHRRGTRARVTGPPGDSGRAGSGRSPAVQRAGQVQDPGVPHPLDHRCPAGTGRAVGEPVPPDWVAVPIEAGERLLEAVTGRPQRPVALGGGFRAALVDRGPGQPVPPAERRARCAGRRRSRRPAQCQPGTRCSAPLAESTSPAASCPWCKRPGSRSRRPSGSRPAPSSVSTPLSPPEPAPPGRAASPAARPRDPRAAVRAESS